METKILELNLGGLRPLQASSQEYTPGWYVDPETGQPVYYDGVTRTFYTLSGGVYLPLGYMNPAPKQVSLGPGERLKVSISYKYSGPAVSGAIERFCVGVYGSFGFTEQIVGTNTRSLSQSTTPLTYTGEYTFTIPTSVGTDWNDIYCKISGGSPGVNESIFGYENALVITGKDPTISEFKITDFVKV
jgi:hypothetical protein